MIYIYIYIHGSLDIRCTNRTFYHFGSLFAILPSDHQKKKFVEKMKKIPGDIITLHLCAKSDNHYDVGS